MYRIYPGHWVVRSWADVRLERRARVLEAGMLELALAPSGGRLSAYCGLERYNRNPDWYSWREVPLGEGVVDEVRSGWMKESTWLCFADR